MDDKIIVTNLSALKAKYKTVGAAKIKTACDQLIAADKKRGLATRIVNIDDAQTMKKLGGTAVTNRKDPAQNKRAIDAVYKKLTPDYILILGSIDVVPHQDMKNPVPADGAAHAAGDLPYACEKGYSRKPEDFVGPTRVVGRIPDLVGDTDPAYLIGLLKTASNFKTRPIADYNGYFAISAALWEGSTRMSLDSVFGFNDSLNLCPDKGPKWTPASLSKKLHFINCHGGTASPTFQGQKRKGKPGVTYPDAHDAALLKNMIVEGTVAAVECCYGAEQYDAKLFADGKTSISSAYLAGKAYGFFGSSTIAYGPADDNGAADLICQYFLKYVLEGASLGRAALQARQDFAQSSPNLDPMDIKTLAQFSLLGDPAVVPIKASSPHLVATPKAKSNAKTSTSAKFAPPDSKTIERGERRQQLFTKGTWLSKNQPVCSSTPDEGTSKAVEATMKDIASRANIKDPTMTSYSIKRKSSPGASFAKSMTATAFHVAMPAETNGAKKESVSALVCVVAKEVDGRIVSYRELHSKK
jgi:hypothetical protein